MNSIASPIVTFIVVILIGIVAGILAQRYARGSWLSQQIAGRNRATATCALVGIAGAFIGFHLAVLLELLKYGSIALFIAAAVGALVVLWGWKTVRG
jgi:uncharacterized membrane protein YeaQ/YmgE (transglycosylase-associated protein family)